MGCARLWGGHAKEGAILTPEICNPSEFSSFSVNSFRLLLTKALITSFYNFKFMYFKSVILYSTLSGPRVNDVNDIVMRFRGLPDGIFLM